VAHTSPLMPAWLLRGGARLSSPTPVNP
jgi:hypothetical protein